MMVKGMRLSTYKQDESTGRHREFTKSNARSKSGGLCTLPGFFSLFLSALIFFSLPVNCLYNKINLVFRRLYVRVYIYIYVGPL